MFPTISILALFYASSVAFLQLALAAAPEAYEDESGFHLES